MDSITAERPVADAMTAEGMASGLGVVSINIGQPASFTGLMLSGNGATVGSYLDCTTTDTWWLAVCQRTPWYQTAGSGMPGPSSTQPDTLSGSS